MSARHYAALQIVTEHETDISNIVDMLNVAVADCQQTGANLNKDAAVLLLSTHLTFVTGCDKFLSGSYTKLVDICQKEVERELALIPAPELLN